MRTRFSALLLSIVSCLLIGSVSCTARAADRPPNILIILVDDMGYGDLGCFGSKQIPTPHIDALAKDGIRCTQGYVSGAVCAPSRAGLMTGRYQERFGYEHNMSYAEHTNPESVAVPRDEKMMPAYLKQANYATAIIGKWHLGGRDYDWHYPTARGFDYYFGRYGGHGYFPTVESKQMYRNTEPVQTIDVPYTTDWYTQEAIDFINRTPRDQPWFLYLAHDTPHTPLQAKEEDIARFSHIQDKKRRIYAAMQHCLDVNVGRLVNHLKTTGQYDNTLIVFLSDNGGPCTSNASINAPLRGQKALVLEGGVRVPYIFVWPDKLEAGQTYTQPFISLDLLPTFLAAAGIDRSRAENPRKPLDGVNLLPYLLGEKGDRRPHETFFWRIILRSKGMRSGDWKLIRLNDRPPMLFNLADDLSEQDDVADDHPDIVRKMMKQMHEWEVSFERNPMFMSEMRWMRNHTRLYDRDYQLTQPE